MPRPRAAVRLLAALSLALLLSLSARAQVDGDFGPATLVIEYQDGNDLLIPATLTLTPKTEAGSHQSAVAEISVLSTKGQWVHIDRLLSSGHQTGIRARAMLPAPDAIAVVLIKTPRGPWQGWKVEEGESYANQEVSYFDQSGRRVESGPCEPRACLARLTDASGQAESSASSFTVEISGIRKPGGGR